MKTKLAVVVCCAAVSVFAGTESHLVIAYGGTRNVAACLRRKADFAVMPLTITSDHRDPGRRVTDVEQVRDAILKLAEKDEGIEVRAGIVRLSPEPGGKFGSFSALSHTADSDRSQADLHVLTRIGEPGLFKAAKRLQTFVDQIKLPDKTWIRRNELSLAMEDPEQFRQEILALIAEDIRALNKTMGVQGRVGLHGLEEPVLVRQASTDQVELFINYRMTLEFDTGGADAESGTR